MLDCIVTFRASYALCTVILLVSDRSSSSNTILYFVKRAFAPQTGRVRPVHGDIMPKFSIILWKSCSLFNVVLELYVSIHVLCYSSFTLNCNQ